MEKLWTPKNSLCTGESAVPIWLLSDFYKPLNVPF